MISNKRIEHLKSIEVIEKKLSEILLIREQTRSRIKLLEKKMKQRRKELLK